MKTTALTCLFAIFATAGTAHADRVATLRFKNGDSLPGRLHSITHEKIVWDSPGLEENATFPVPAIRELRLPGAPVIPAPPTEHMATLILTNGDVVSGQLAAVDDDKVSLDTWYAGRMVFRRAMVRDIAIREFPEPIYRGPLPIEEWTQSEKPGTWMMNAVGELVSKSGPGGIAPNMALPEAFTLEFDVRWEEKFMMEVDLFANDPEAAKPDKGYSIFFQYNAATLRRMGQRENLGYTVRARELREHQSARIRIQASAKTGKFVLYVDDRLIEMWTDENLDAARIGPALRFVTSWNSPSVTISRVAISKWSGNPDLAARHFGYGNWEEDPPDEPETKKPETTMLNDGDRIRGTVKTFDGKSITFQTPSHEVSLPIERVRDIPGQSTELEQAKRQMGDVRAWFVDGGSIVFRAEGLNEDGAAVLGFSQNFGNARFDLTAFSRIDFNIYDLLEIHP
jgi:hypothetical protein